MPLGRLRNLPIERCDKCSKSFMSKSEVERHKMWEHPVPVSPFEDRLAATTTNRGVNSAEDPHKLTSDVMAGSSSSGDAAMIGGGQRRRRRRRKAPFRPSSI
jgi:hypothetical protein